MRRAWITGSVKLQTVSFALLGDDPMLFPENYSRRTVCPYCDARVRLEEVRFTPTFQCPQCEGYIKVSETYRSAVRWLSWIPGILVLFAFGVRSWWLLLLSWIPSFFVGMLLWTWAGVYLVPPKLEKA